MKTTLPLLIIFSLACGPKPGNQSDLAIEKFYYQISRGGYEGSGNTYVIYLYLQKQSEDLKLDKIQFRGITGSFEQNEQNPLLYLSYLKMPPRKREKMILHGDITREYGNKPPEVAQDSLPPDEARLYYEVAGEAKTMLLKPMIQKPESENPRLRN